MKRWPIVTVALDQERDVVSARQRARRLAALLGFDTQDQTRIATAVSEIARNANSYGAHGRAEFALEGLRSPDRLTIRVTDRGQGMADVAAVLEGRLEPRGGGLGLGLAGARRLMDAFALESRPGVETRVSMSKRLPAGGAAISPERLAEVARALAAEAAGDPLEELRAQNRELLESLQAEESRRVEAVHLSEELERTNKGVVALYAELDRRAVELEELNATLERRVQEGVAERARVEESLRQSQKMEAVGQLTGGIAHDFNNLLMVIGGSLEMLRRRLPDDPRTGRLLDAAIQGVARGGALNKQLLAFARRQDLRAETVRLDQLAPAFVQLAERAVSEDIRIETRIVADPWWCRTDPHQLETAVLNLAINARDAMPGGGMLTLTIGNREMDVATAEPWEAKPGEYAAVSVGDTGAGIAPEVLARVFEPFFTTKAVGRGTGLGLSQVYGFAKQSGGFVTVESALDRGTTVTIHLPRVAAPEPEQKIEASAPARIPGAATVLVVEDDAAVRATAAELLRELGYRVLETETGRRALEVLQAERVDLVFTDVILPDGMSGADVARAVRELAPGAAILLTSGYTGHRLESLTEANLRLLSKPYSEAELSEAVQAALRERAPA